MRLGHVEYASRAFGDRGLTAAKDRLSRVSKVSGWLEFRHVRNLEKLAGLRDRGILTDEEFQAKKAQNLGL